MKSKKNCPNFFFRAQSGFLVMSFHHVLKFLLSYRTKKKPYDHAWLLRYFGCVDDDNSIPNHQNFLCQKFVVNVLSILTKVFDTKMTTQLVSLGHCCMDVNDSTTHTCTHSFSSNNWIMLGWSKVLHVVGWVAMSKSKLFLGHWMWASSEFQMVAIGKDKASTPCSKFENID